jgi:hypothetical protein
MLRTAVYSLGCSVLILCLPVSQALSCPTPLPERWTQASANGEYELIVEPSLERDEDGLVFDGATFRLERVGIRRETVWEVKSAGFQREALVANDGDYVATVGWWFGAPEITIRNSAGAVIRSLSEDDLVSIAEQLDGASWSLVGLDDTEEYLVIEVSGLAASTDSGHPVTRRIQLMDGDVVEPPITPPGFEIPGLECPAPAARRVLASPGVLMLLCNADDRSHSSVRSYEFADAQFRLVAVREHGPQGGEGRWWREVGTEDEPGPCETIYRNGEVASERCGPDVTSP